MASLGPRHAGSGGPHRRQTQLGLRKNLGKAPTLEALRKIYPRAKIIKIPWPSKKSDADATEPLPDCATTGHAAYRIYLIRNFSAGKHFFRGQNLARH
jgi:hypothetical protein